MQSEISKIDLLYYNITFTYGCIYFTKKRKQNNRWDPKNCRIGRRLQDILKWSWNPGDCVMETEPFATIKLIFKIQGKTICFITPSNTHTISNFSNVIFLFQSFMSLTVSFNIPKARSVASVRKIWAGYTDQLISIY